MTIALSAAQKKIVDFGDGPLVVVAGPGSGKTRVLTERVRRLLSEGNNRFRVLALTFTNKAANEMKARLSEYPDIDKRGFIGTLHSFCTEVLANRGTAIGIEQLPVIFEATDDRRQVLLQSALDDPTLHETLSEQENQKEQKKLLDSWLDRIRDYKSSLISSEDVEDDLDKRVYDAYESGLKASGAIDFDDLLLLSYKLFEEHPKIADFYRRQYRYICIDEAQDLNEAQYGLLRMLCGSDYKNVMMVGDPKQAIFVFNGASPKYLKRFEEEFDATVISLDENFRSSQKVVAAAKAIASNYEAATNLALEGEVVCFNADDQESEAAEVVGILKRLLVHGHKDIEPPLLPDKCAILGRTRYVLLPFEEALKKANIPYYRYVSSQNESESDCIKDFELSMRVFANPTDVFHRRSLLRQLGQSEREFETISDLLGEDLDQFQRAALEAINMLGSNADDITLPKALDSLTRFANNLSDLEERALILQDIDAWRKHWDHFVRSRRGGQHSLSDFLTQVALGSTQQTMTDGVGLLTIHSSKGLEFDVVFIVGLAEGTFPDYRAKGRALQEERRNAFVAVTRSRRLLYLSYSRTKVMPWGDVWSQEPSIFLQEISAALPSSSNNRRSSHCQNDDPVN